MLASWAGLGLRIVVYCRRSAGSWVLPGPGRHGVLE